MQCFGALPTRSWPPKTRSWSPSNQVACACKFDWTCLLARPAVCNLAEHAHMRVVVVRKHLFGMQETACKHGAHVRDGMPTLVIGTLLPKISELRLSNT